MVDMGHVASWLRFSTLGGHTNIEVHWWLQALSAQPGKSDWTKTEAATGNTSSSRCYSYTNGPKSSGWRKMV